MSLDNMPKLELGGNVAASWKQWKRALEILFQAKGEQVSSKKKLLLLHYGSISLQDIYYNLIDENKVKNEDETKAYENAIDILDSHFLPKSSAALERKLFRQIKQEKGEPINQFVLKLRGQGSKCEFKDIEEHIMEQIIIGTRHPGIEKKVIEKGSVKLDELVTMIQSIELNEDDTPQEINKVGSKGKTVGKADTRCSHSYERKNDYSQSRMRSPSRNKSQGPSYSRKDNRDLSCYRCGRTGHFARSMRCPARDKKCEKCQKYGHFRSVCRTDTPKEKVRFINDEGETDTSSDSSNMSSEVLSVAKVGEIKREVEVICKVGGIRIRLMVDTGARVNLISEYTWKRAKDKGIKFSISSSSFDRELKGYNSTIKVVDIVRTTIEYKDNVEEIDLYVVEGQGASLMGCETALALKVVSFNINSISNKGKLPNTNKTGKLKGIQADIQIDKSVTPVRQPYRRIPIPLKEKVSERLKELLDNDIIEKADGTSRWLSPLVVTSKDQGRDVRLCIDMRRANQAVRREMHPLPTFDDIMPNLSKSTIFSILDVKNAFHQVEITPQSREITTFITHEGIYRFKRLMFGLNCASEIYQRLMENLLVGIEGVYVYIDDILVSGENNDKHDNRLKRVLKTLDDNGIILNEKKCQFGKSEIKFMGHLISKEGIKPTEDRVKAIKSFRDPESKEEVRSFLGLLNYVGKFIPNLATLSEPLKKLTRKDCNFVWNKEQAQNFEKLKGLIIEKSMLGFYDPKDKTTIVADASPVGLGAVLIQEKGNQTRVIAYASKGLTETERKYYQGEKEALAIVWAVEKFKMYVTGKQFHLITDHKALETLFKNTSKPCARIERWVLRLQSFDFKVVFRPGKTNIADPLSRLCTNQDTTFDENGEMYINSIAQMAKPKAITIESIREETQVDSELISLSVALKNDKWTESIAHYKRFTDELSEINGIILRQDRIVVPKSLQAQILKLAHEGHPGEGMMKRRLRKKVWWYNIDRDAVHFVKTCESCQIVAKQNNPEPLAVTELPQKCWSQLRADYLGPLPSGDNLLVIIDEYSKYVIVEPMRSTTSAMTITKFKNLFTRYGLPETLITDNGPQFRSSEFNEFCGEHNIKLKHTIPYSPSSNGVVERQNRSLVKRLKIAQLDKEDWKEELNSWLFLYTNSTHPSTGVSPAQAMFRRDFREKIPSIEKEVDIYDEDIRHHNREDKLRRKLYIDQKRKAVRSNVEKGDVVLRQNERLENKLSTTFDKNRYKVVERKGKMVKIENDDGQQFIKRSDQVKRFNERESSDDTVDKDNSDRYIELDTSSENWEDMQTMANTTENIKNDGIVDSLERRSTRVRNKPSYFKDYEM